MSSFPLLSALVFTPWVGAALLACLRPAELRWARGVSLAFSLSTLVLGACAWSQFDPVGGLQFSERHEWIPSLGVQYHLALDGMSLLLVLLTGIVGPTALLASWRERRGARAMHAFFLLLQGSALGVFLALDFFHWFVFWELSLIPAYFLIKLWGGPDATRAAYQFVIYTIGGSAFMLLAFAAIVAATGTPNFVALAELATTGELARKLAAAGPWWSHAVFLGVFLGLAVKVPLWPFHTWLPAAYAEAPTGASMFLTGVMSKMGVYGFLRILWPLFPAELQAAAPCLTWLALAGVVFGALAALRQTDVKRMVAYSSVNHLSYCLLALFAVAGAAPDTAEAKHAIVAALCGCLLQAFNHGLSGSALFWVAGTLQQRAGSALRAGTDAVPMSAFGGVRSAAPIFAGLAGVALFSSLGLPGLNGFVGEFLIFRGVFGLAPWAAGVATLGLLATALFLLTFWQRVFHGPRGPAVGSDFRDLHGADYAVIVPLAFLMLLLGLVPQLLTSLVNPLVTTWAGGSLP